MNHLFHDPTFWVAVSFFIFVALAWKPVGKVMAHALDTRSAQIRTELEDAVRLREEAEQVLAAYQQKQRESLAEADRILAQTRADAEAMTRRAETELKASLDKRRQMAMDKIAQAETTALQSVQQHVVDIAISAAKTVIGEQLSQGKADDLIRIATQSIERKIH